MSVTEPGLVFDLPNDAYHEQTAWASSSELKRLLPEHYKAGGSQEALDFGTLFHTAVLEPDNLAEYVALDAEKIGLKADGTPAQSPTMTAAWKRAVAEVVQDGKQVVAQSDLDRALAMREAVLAHPTAPSLLYSEGGHVEESAFAHVEGTPCRARFDRRIPGVIVDLKSTSAKPGADSLRRAMWDYGYHLSAAHYLAVAEALDLECPAFALVFVSKAPPHHVTVAEIGAESLDAGRELRDLAIRRHTDPTEPAYPGASGFITL